jgi:hypothetical protein
VLQYLPSGIRKTVWNDPAENEWKIPNDHFEPGMRIAAPQKSL